MPRNVKLGAQGSSASFGERRAKRQKRAVPVTPGTPTQVPSPRELEFPTAFAGTGESLPNTEYFWRIREHGQTTPSNQESQPRQASSQFQGKAPEAEEHSHPIVCVLATLRYFQIDSSTVDFFLYSCSEPQQ